MTPLLSILDLSPIESGSTSREALRTSVELARLADRLGYHRVWYAEHHNLPGLASASPEVLIAHVAGQTTHIRVGSGGVMLPNHAPLRIAEAFKLLESLYPGRIDLGLGRAPGTDRRTAAAIRQSSPSMGVDDYPERLSELLSYGDETSVDSGATIAIPVDAALPNVLLLGSSDYSAQLAAFAGLGFAFAAHINTPGAVGALRNYREAFRPSRWFHEPWSILAVSVVVGETDEHARELALIADLIRLRLRTGQLSGYPTFEDATTYPFTPAERQFIEEMPMRSLVGDASAVGRLILDFQDQTYADEVMITMLPARADRERAILQLASQFGLSPRAMPGSDDLDMPLTSDQRGHATARSQS